MKSSSFLSLLLALASRADAAHHRLSGRLGSGLHPTTRVDDFLNMGYFINITLNEEPFSVLIDTGSSDLWVSDSVPGAVSQKYEAAVTYASGSASGTVKSATLDLGGYTIDSQFYIEALNATMVGDGDGLVGFGPPLGSAIRAGTNSSKANPPLDRIFASNSSISPMIGIHLQRLGDTEDPYPGYLSIGEVLTDFRDVLDQPKLPVTSVPLGDVQHWQTLLDVDGIIVNGQRIEITTNVTGASTKNATVIVDTGFTFPQVPPYVAHAIYGGVLGAVLRNLSQIGMTWTLPCDRPVNVTFLFMGKEFPIHPLDTNFDLNLTENGKPYCIGSFQPTPVDTAEQDIVSYDMIFGMACLRNMYTVINFGDMAGATTSSTNTSYIQLLSITNATQAAQDFAYVRNNTGSEFASQLRSNRRKRPSGPWPSWLIALVGSIGVLLLLLSCCITYWSSRRRRTKSASTDNTDNTLVYRSIHEPSPLAAYDMYMAPGTPRGHTAPEYEAR